MTAIEKLEEEIAELAAHLDSATQRLLGCIRAFDLAGGWERQGAISCAHWLAWRLGLDTATAREKVRVARALGELPRIDEALGRGELSYAKVRALTRVATPATEARLLDLARHATGAQLERICRGYRRAVRSLEDGPLAAEERSVRERPLPGGMVRIELVLSPDEAALVMKAVERARDDLRDDRTRETAQARASDADPSTDASAERSARRPAIPASETTAGEAPAVSMVDGVVNLAERFLAAGGWDAGGEAGTGARGGDRYQVLVHLDQDVLGPDGQRAATLDDGSHLSAETLRRIACDAGLVPTLSARSGAYASNVNETTAADAPMLNAPVPNAQVANAQVLDDTPVLNAPVLDIGRRTRSIPPAIRRALWLRDRGCRFPGCPHRRFLHGHHIHHWLHGGATRLDNLVLLCTRHHRLVHEGGFTIERAVERAVERADQSMAALTFRAPGGKAIVAVPSAAAIEDAIVRLHTWAQERDIQIEPDTNFPWWDGAVPDYDLAVASVMSP
jgi:hypothetical protein